MAKVRVIIPETLEKFEFDAGNNYSVASDITFLGLFEWLEYSDRRFSIKEFLNSLRGDNK